MVRILQVRLQRDHRLCCKFFDLAFDVSDIAAPRLQFLVDIGEQLLG